MGLHIFAADEVDCEGGRTEATCSSNPVDKVSPAHLACMIPLLGQVEIDYDLHIG